jgi:V/A-type H+-transporting ATPase subunit E
MSGITNIIEIINAKTEEKEKKILGEAERHKKIKLEEAKRRADEAASAITKRAESQTKAEISKYEASAKLKSKYRMLEAKDTLIKEVLESAQKKLQDVVGKAEYKKVLERLIIEGCKALKVDKVDLIFPKGHASKIDIAQIEKAVNKEVGKKTKLSISKETVRSIGGIVIRNEDATKWVDNTFEARLERMQNQVRETIAEILFRE